MQTTHARPALVQLQGVCKSYPDAQGELTALQSIDLQVQAGEFVAVIGKSGSGKSTLLNLLAGIDRPNSGQIRIAETDLGGLGEAALSAWRGRTVGLVFQFFQLLPALSAAENVMLPMDFCARWPRAERGPRAIALLERLGVAEQAHKLPSQMSGGQQQRVAIARALANQPPLLLADEPTGNLDSESAQSLLALLQELAANGQTVIMVTHEAAAQRCAQRSVRLEDGRLLDLPADAPARS